MITARIEHLFDRVEMASTHGVGARHGKAWLKEQRFIFFASDPERARGALGVADGKALSQAIAAALTERLPMVWLLDSAGAKVDEGLSALAAFRHFYRAALLAKQSGARILAVLGRGCYGGASLLAMLADYRIYTPATRLSTTGPAIIEGVEGKEVFDAADQASVSALLGTHARLAVDSAAEEAADGNPRASIELWLHAHKPESSWEAHHPILSARLIPTQACEDFRGRLQPLLPTGYVAEQRGNIVYSIPSASSEKALFCGFLTGGAFGAQDAWQLVDLLSQIAQSHPRSPIVLLLDASGHAARVADERILLAQYLVHLCRCVTDLTARGHRTALWIVGGASGAVYVAFASPVQRVSVLSTARVEILGSYAVDKILGRAVAGASGCKELVELGVADAVLDARLETYQRI